LRDFTRLKLVNPSGAGGVSRTSFFAKWAPVLASAALVSVFVIAGLIAVERLSPQPIAAVDPGGISTKEIKKYTQGPTTVTARVTGITDGDTITVRSQAGEQIKIRLVEIDAPESNQPWGGKAKAALAKLVSGRDVEIRTAGTDQYGRTLGRVFVGETDVNAEMIQAGHAWAYRDYLTDKSLLTIEMQAREAKRGLWSLPFNDRLAPWEWRHNPMPSPQARNVPNASFTPAASNQCRGKRYCREMASCEEARFYLNVCRVDSLDGDDDGIPCETICRNRFR
jgi:endonuclease YncB( thermonuclease family)